MTTQCDQSQDPFIPGQAGARPTFIRVNVVHNRRGMVDSDSDSDYSAASVRHLPSFVINSGPHRCPQQTTRTRHGHFVLNSNTALISPMHCTICW